MKETNQKVKQKRLENFSRRIQIKDLKDIIKNYENAELVKIDDEKDAAGKKLFSNEAKRSLELAMRLSSDKIFQDMKKQLSELEKEFETEQIEIDYLTWEMTLSGHRNDDIVEAINNLAKGITVRK